MERLRNILSRDRQAIFRCTGEVDVLNLDQDIHNTRSSGALFLRGNKNEGSNDDDDEMMMMMMTTTTLGMIIIIIIATIFFHFIFPDQTNLNKSKQPENKNDFHKYLKSPTRLGISAGLCQ